MAKPGKTSSYSLPLVTLALTQPQCWQYRGLSPWLLFSMPKVALRFTAFETAMEVSKDWNVSVGTRSLASGLLAGALESSMNGIVLNTVYVRMLDDMNRKNPRFRSVFHTMRVLVAEEGLRGIYRGAAPQLAKQSCNQALRFFIFSEASRMYTGSVERPLTTLESLVAGGIAGAISVFVSHPLDVVKTRMQGLDGQRYGTAFNCAKVTLSEGAMFNGVWPRLVRVSAEVALQFALFHHIAKIMDDKWP